MVQITLTREGQQVIVPIDFRVETEGRYTPISNSLLYDTVPYARLTGVNNALSSLFNPQTLSEHVKSFLETRVARNDIRRKYISALYNTMPDLDTTEGRSAMHHAVVDPVDPMVDTSNTEINLDHIAEVRQEWRKHVLGVAEAAYRDPWISHYATQMGLVNEEMVILFLSSQVKQNFISHHVDSANHTITEIMLHKGNIFHPLVATGGRTQDELFTPLRNMGWRFAMNDLLDNVLNELRKWQTGHHSMGQLYNENRSEFLLAVLASAGKQFHILKVKENGNITIPIKILKQIQVERSEYTASWVKENIYDRDAVPKRSYLDQLNRDSEDAEREVFTNKKDEISRLWNSIHLNDFRLLAREFIRSRLEYWARLRGSAKQSAEDESKSDVVRLQSVALLYTMRDKENLWNAHRHWQRLHKQLVELFASVKWPVVNTIALGGRENINAAGHAHNKYNALIAIFNNIMSGVGSTEALRNYLIQIGWRVYRVDLYDELDAGAKTVFTKVRQSLFALYVNSYSVKDTRLEIGDSDNVEKKIKKPIHDLRPWIERTIFKAIQRYQNINRTVIAPIYTEPAMPVVPYNAFEHLITLLTDEEKQSTMYVHLINNPDLGVAVSQPLFTEQIADPTTYMEQYQVFACRYLNTNAKIPVIAPSIEYENDLIEYGRIPDEEKRRGAAKLQQIHDKVYVDIDKYSEAFESAPYDAQKDQYYLELEHLIPFFKDPNLKEEKYIAASDMFQAPDTIEVQSLDDSEHLFIKTQLNLLPEMKMAYGTQNSDFMKYQYTRHNKVQFFPPNDFGYILTNHLHGAAPKWIMLWEALDETETSNFSIGKLIERLVSNNRKVWLYHLKPGMRLYVNRPGLMRLEITHSIATYRGAVQYLVTENTLWRHLLYWAAPLDNANELRIPKTFNYDHLLNMLYSNASHHTEVATRIRARLFDARTNKYILPVGAWGSTFMRTYMDAIHALTVSKSRYNLFRNLLKPESNDWVILTPENREKYELKDYSLYQPWVASEISRKLRKPKEIAQKIKEDANAGISTEEAFSMVYTKVLKKSAMNELVGTFRIRMALFKTDEELKKANEERVTVRVRDITVRQNSIIANKTAEADHMEYVYVDTDGSDQVKDWELHQPLHPRSSVSEQMYYFASLKRALAVKQYEFQFRVGTGPWSASRLVIYLPHPAVIPSDELHTVPDNIIPDNLTVSYHTYLETVVDEAREAALYKSLAPSVSLLPIHPSDKLKSIDKLQLLMDVQQKYVTHLIQQTDEEATETALDFDVNGPNNKIYKDIDDFERKRDNERNTKKRLVYKSKDADGKQITKTSRILLHHDTDVDRLKDGYVTCTECKKTRQLPRNVLGSQVERPWKCGDYPWKYITHTTPVGDEDTDNEVNRKLLKDNNVDLRKLNDKELATSIRKLEEELQKSKYAVSSLNPDQLNELEQQSNTLKQQIDQEEEKTGGRSGLRDQLIDFDKRIDEEEKFEEKEADQDEEMKDAENEAASESEDTDMDSDSTDDEDERQRSPFVEGEAMSQMTQYLNQLKVE